LNGDYRGLTIASREVAHPIWSDTRNADRYTAANGVARDEDVFSGAAAVPAGQARRAPGRIGSG
jgi:hypothetical protein